MAFPKIIHCLVCEEVRLERRGLSSLLGFYGVAPNVEILVRSFDIPVQLQRLSFLLIGGPGEGRFRLSFQILDDAGIVIVAPSEPVEREFKNIRGKNQNYGIGIGGLTFPRAGTYYFKVLVDDKVEFETTFAVKQGDPEDFE